MTILNTPDATLFISEHCPHCAVMLASLVELVKAGRVGRLEIVNAGARPDLAAARGVRSVPWLALGVFELAGLRSRAEIEAWVTRAGSAQGIEDYVHLMLKEGALEKVFALLSADPARLSALLPILGNPEASLNVRLGAGAVFEDYAGSPALRALVPELTAMARHADARVRADACHVLGLSGADAALTVLRACVTDSDADVREIAEEGLEAWPKGTGGTA